MRFNWGNTENLLLAKNTDFALAKKFDYVVKIITVIGSWTMLWTSYGSYKGFQLDLNFPWRKFQ